jgi:hypothetical protein
MHTKQDIEHFEEQIEKLRAPTEDVQAKEIESLKKLAIRLFKGQQTSQDIMWCMNLQDEQ